MSSNEWKPSGHNDYTGAGLFGKHVQDCLDIAWAAGLFEGEGCLSQPTINGYKYAIISLKMTDLDVVMKFIHVMSTVLHIKMSVYGPYIFTDGRKPQWLTKTGKYTDVNTILNAFWPWLCSRRRAIITKIMSNCDSNRRPNGAESKTAKLIEYEVALIRSLYLTGNFTFETLANKMNIGKTAIRDIVHRHTWKNMTKTIDDFKDTVKI